MGRSTPTSPATGRAAERATSRLHSLFPATGPWTAAALWFGRGRSAEPPSSPLRDELDVLTRQRLAGLALAYIKSARAQVPAEDLRVLQQSAFTWTVLTHTAIRQAPAELTEWRLESPWYAVSKGPGIARLYPRPELRPFSDLDVILERSDFVSVVDSLTAQGWYEEERNEQPWEFFRQYCREGLNLVRTGGGRVDVHHRIPPWLWSEQIDIRATLRRSVPVVVDGREFRCLSDTDNLLVAALHVVSDRNKPGQSLLVWRDIVELALTAPIEDVVLRAREADLVGWLATVLQALPEAFGTDALLRALLDEDGEVTHPRRLSALLSSQPARWGVVGTQALRLPLANGLLFAGGMLLPSPGFLRTRFPDQSKRYRQWWRDARDSHSGDLTSAE